MSRELCVCTLDLMKLADYPNSPALEWPHMGEGIWGLGPQVPSPTSHGNLGSLVFK